MTGNEITNNNSQTSPSSQPQVGQSSKIMVKYIQSLISELREYFILSWASADMLFKLLQNMT